MLRDLATRRSLLPILAGVAWVVTVPLLKAQDQPASVHAKLDVAVHQMAGEVSRCLEQRKQGRIILGSFMGPETVLGNRLNCGARIVQLLQDDLQGDVQLVRQNAYMISGEYVGRKEGKEFVTIIKARMEDVAGIVVRDCGFETRITDLKEAVRLNSPSSFNASQDGAGLPSAGPVGPAERPLKSQEELVNRLVESLQHPTLHRQGSVIKPSPKSPYGIELLIETDGDYTACPLDPEAARQGIARVNIGPDQVFAVRIHNTSSRRVGVALTMDGINSFAFSQNPAWKKAGTWVIGPGGGTVTGWHYSDETIYKFVVTKYGNSAASYFAVTEGVGTITATFHGVIKSKGSRPKYAVGLGEEAKMRIQRVPFEVSKPMLGAVSVHYQRPTPPSSE